MPLALLGFVKDPTTVAFSPLHQRLVDVKCDIASNVNPRVNVAVARWSFGDSGRSAQCYSALAHGPRSIALSFKFNGGG